MDADTGAFYFIEVNPRIQVEHTVTELVTGIDIVKAQIRIAEGAPPRHAARAACRRRTRSASAAHALQCRITTEDPENNFIPDYGRITAYRSPAGFGIRLDGGTAYSGAVITRSYDSLLVKVTAWAPSAEETIARMDRALCGVPHPRRRDQPRASSSSSSRIRASRAATTRRASSTRRRSCSPPETRDRATKLLTYIGDVIVNGHPEAAGPARGRRSALPAKPPPRVDAATAAPGTRQRLDELGPQAFAAWMRERAARARSPTRRCATRTSRCSRRACARSTCCAIAPPIRRRSAAAVLAGMLGRGDLRRRDALPARGPVGAAGAAARAGAEHPAPDAAARRQRGRLHQLSRQRRALFRRSAPPAPASTCSASSTASTGSRTCASRSTRCCEAGKLVRGGDLLHRRHPATRARRKYSLDYYVRARQASWSAPARTSSASRTWRACCRPRAAYALVKALQEEVGLPIHFHTHDTSGHRAPPACWRRSRPASTRSTRAIDAMSGLTSQPCLGSLVEALRHGAARHRPRSGAAAAHLRYWEEVRRQYAAFESDLRAGASEVYCTRCPAGSSPT